MNIAIIGGGAAGFFSAIAAKENHPDSSVTILEKTQKLLSKVKVSGGGKCNVTNACFSIKELSAAFPRGGRQLKKAFNMFSTKDTIAWFEARGVPLDAGGTARVALGAAVEDTLSGVVQAGREVLGRDLTGIGACQPGARAERIQRSRVPWSMAPDCRAISCPPRNAMTVGMERMP